METVSEIGQATLTPDGTRATVNLELASGRQLQLSLDTDEDLKTLMCVLLEVAHHAGRIRGVGQSYTTSKPGDGVPLQASAWGLSLAGQGMSSLFLRVGTVDLAVLIENPKLSDLAERFARHAELVSREPGQVQ